MKRTNLQAFSMLLLISCLIVMSCNNEDKNTSTTDSTVTHHDSIPGTTTDTANVPLVNHAEALLTATYSDTAVTGSAKFDAADGKVKMTIEITVPAKANKEIAVHIHEHGDCGDNGKLAHGHWNPSNTQHGKWGSAAFHAGDIGNIKLDGSGKGTLTIDTDLWTLGGTANKNILGKALIVHGGTDDFTTQPTGNAGSRIGCGVIK